MNGLGHKDHLRLKILLLSPFLEASYYLLTKLFPYQKGFGKACFVSSTWQIRGLTDTTNDINAPKIHAIWLL